MNSKVSRWGNSLGVRVPAEIAAEVGLVAGSEVRVISEGRSIKLIPSRSRRHNLKDLLTGIKRSNLHGETSTGHAVGAEIIE